MKAFFLPVVACLGLPAAVSQAQVLVSDSGVQTHLIGPGAPAHTVGLQRHQQTIVLDTGKQTYGLRYVVARDPKNPRAAIPGEGYIGMPQPADCNWYAGGFFDLRINGRSIGTTLIQSLTGRGSRERGTADFVFDSPQAMVRVRFVAESGGDCLFAQALLEPKEPIRSVRFAVRCYPSAFVSDADRHVLTPLRDWKQGQRAQLDVARECWTLYYDRIYDAGYVGATYRGVGPCAVLWLPGQTEKAGFTVGSYGIETVYDLIPAQRDFRFLFLDCAGTKNEAAKADLQRRGAALVRKLSAFEFTDPGLRDWPLAEKQAEIRRVLSLAVKDEHAIAKYDRLGRELAAQLKLIHAGAAGVIMAEARAAQIIQAWEQGLPELRLTALLNEI